jgi:hypothetical protein
VASNETVGATAQAQQNAPEPHRINLRNTNLNEINAMIRVGHDQLLYALPYLSPQVLEGYNHDPELVGEHQVDFIGQVESQIAYLKSRNEDASGDEHFLTQLQRIDGSPLPGEIDLEA